MCNMFRLLLSLISVLVAAGIMGCGGAPGDQPDIGSVSGKITVDGKSGSNLEVAFQPESGRPSLGRTDDSGYYELRYSSSEMGAKVGKHVVRISTPDTSEDKGDEEGEDEEVVDPIPAKYNAEAVDNPDMNVEVKAGSNEFNFDLQSN